MTPDVADRRIYNTIRVTMYFDETKNEPTIGIIGDVFALPFIGSYGGDAPIFGTAVDRFVRPVVFRSRQFRSPPLWMALTGAPPVMIYVRDTDVRRTAVTNGAAIDFVNRSTGRGAICFCFTNEFIIDIADRARVSPTRYEYVEMCTAVGRQRHSRAQRFPLVNSYTAG